jgi:hypothetical protein
VRSALRRDIQAVFERDPACGSYVHAVLYFKGFHALQVGEGRGRELKRYYVIGFCDYPGARTPLVYIQPPSRCTMVCFC